MSFSLELKNELSELSVRAACCKKALARGILLDATHTPDTDEVTVTLPDADIAATVRKLFAGVFGKAPTVTEKTVIGKPRYIMTQTSRTAAAMLDTWDAGNSDTSAILTCPECPSMFLRGALIGCATANDPQKECHLEFFFKHTARAALLYSILSEIAAPPKPVNRKTGCGLYYKSSSVIEDILLQCGAQQAAFAIINGKIENEIRNTENRVNNCDTRNLQKAITASHKHITAIRFLKSEPKLWESMPEELRTTATLRLEHPEASLTELVRLHNPPISKSGLNHRLAKLLELAQSEQDKH